MTQITYPSGRIVQQTPDSIGRLQTIASGGTNHVSIPASGGYNAAGQVLSMNYGNGVTANFGYSAAREFMTSLSYAKSANTLFNLNYYYQTDPNCSTGTAGANGQIQCITDGVDSGRTVKYTYDALGRLSTAVSNGSTGFPRWGISESFDRYGNRLSQGQTAGSPPANSLTFATTPVPPANPPGGAYTNRPDGYSFDPSGNMLNDGVNTLTYDVENCMLSSANSSTGTTAYTCDAHGVRVKKALQGSTTTVYLFSGGKDIAEYDYVSSPQPPTSPSREYIYAGGHLLATIQSTSTIYHHQDHLSVRLTTDVNGNKIGEQGHYPYGELWYASNTTTKFFFTSYERDSESGNDYAMARYYINRFGRFCSADPLMGKPGDPQSWNRYTYVQNDPTDMVDPSGLNSVWRNILNIILGFITGGFHLPVMSPQGTPPFVVDPTGFPGSFGNGGILGSDPHKMVINNFVDIGALGLCTQSLFQVGLVSFTEALGRDANRTPGTEVNGSFVGAMAGIYTSTGKPRLPGPSVFTVTTDLSFNFRQTSANYQISVNEGKSPAIPPGYAAAGYTSPSWPFENHVAWNDPNDMAEDQIWELGNSLSFITGKHIPQHYNVTKGPKNTEAGNLLLNCYRSYTYN